MTLADEIFQDAPIALPDTPERPESPYVNPTARPQARRLKPVLVDGIVQALRAGVPGRVIAREYGVSQMTVRRIAAKHDADPRLAQNAEVLSELADAERELRASGMDPQAVEDLIQLARVGHLMRRDRERRQA